MNYIVGIDEAGRGPLAGPVAVGAVKIPLGFNKNFFKSIKDSKKLSQKKREELYKLITKNQNTKVRVWPMAVDFVSVIKIVSGNWVIKNPLRTEESAPKL